VIIVLIILIFVLLGVFGLLVLILISSLTELGLRLRLRTSRAAFCAAHSSKWRFSSDNININLVCDLSSNFNRDTCDKCVVHLYNVKSCELRGSRGLHGLRGTRGLQRRGLRRRGIDFGCSLGCGQECATLRRVRCVKAGDLRGSRRVYFGCALRCVRCVKAGKLSFDNSKFNHFNRFTNKQFDVFEDLYISKLSIVDVSVTVGPSLICDHVEFCAQNWTKNRTKFVLGSNDICPKNRTTFVPVEPSV
jgi:hypothetical protein